MKKFIFVLAIVAWIAGVIHLDNQMVIEKYGNTPPPKNAKEALNRLYSKTDVPQPKNAHEALQQEFK